MSSKRHRLTILFLSLTTILIGVAISVLLYLAGQEAIDAFYTHETYVDRQGRIYRKNPDDDAVGELLMRGWGFGFLYIAPGITGLATALLYFKGTMIGHLVLSVFVLLVGSFVHTTGVMAIVVYRVLANTGAIRYDPVFGDCVFQTIDPLTNEDIQTADQKCLTSRQALIFGIIALALFLLGWILLFTNVLYCAFTYHVVQKNIKSAKQNESKNDASRSNSIHKNPTSTTWTQTSRRRPCVRTDQGHSSNIPYQHGSNTEIVAEIRSSTSTSDGGDNGHSMEGQGNVKRVNGLQGNGNKGNSNHGYCDKTSPREQEIPRRLSSDYDKRAESIQHDECQGEGHTSFGNHGDTDNSSTVYDGNDRHPAKGITNQGYDDKVEVQLQTVIVQDEKNEEYKESTSM